MQIFVNEIARMLAKAGGPAEEETLSLLETPPRSEMGDYALPCFILAGREKKNPAAVAADLAARLKGGGLIERIENRGPYLNFFVNHTAFLREALSEIFKDGERFGTSDAGGGKTIVIDYSSPNIAKEFRVFHLRTTVLGHALYNLYRALGYNVIGINHLGDWGTQFGVVIAAFREKGDERALGEHPLKYLTSLYVDYNRRMAEDESLRVAAREWLKKLEEGDPEAKRLWKLFCDLSIEDFKRVYKRLGIEFQYYQGEAFYFKLADSVIEAAEKAGAAEESQGALVIKMPYENMPPVILRKSDGATSYHTRDIAAAIYRRDNFHFHKLLYVVGAEQKLHFQQLVHALRKMGFDWADSLVHVAHGLYLESQEVDGVQVKTKAGTRTGFKIVLEDILDDAVARAEKVIDENYPDGFPGDKTAAAEAVGIGAIVFGDLKNSRIKDVVFDWDAAMSFKGETGPYLQYSHARLCSILRKYGRPVEGDVDFGLLSDPEEYEIAKLAAQYPEVLKKAADAYEPSLLSTYLLSVASAFNRYYTDLARHKVVDSANPELTRARVLLTDCARLVLASGLNILGIIPLSQM